MTRELRRSTTCLNCGATVSDNFCGACGQENTDYRVSLRRLVGDLADEVFQLESRLWRSLWTLFRRPGHLTVEYNAGRRVRYTTPLRLYLLASVLYFFGVGPPDPNSVSVDLRGAPTAKLRAGNRVQRWLARRVEASQKDPQAAVQRSIQAIGEWGPRAMAILVPFFALLTFALFRRPRHFFVEHLVFALHLHAAAFLAWLASDLIGHASGLILFAALVVWLIVAVRRVFAQPWWHLVWKLPLLGVIYVIAVSLGVGAVMILGALNV